MAGFWAECERCGKDIYIAQIADNPNSRWLPFDDQSLGACHLDYCDDSKIVKGRKFVPKVIRRHKSGSE
jgi:hypothetical protein